MAVNENFTCIHHIILYNMTINLCQIISQKKEINSEYDAFWVTASFHICGLQTPRVATVVVLSAVADARPCPLYAAPTRTSQGA